MGKKRFDEQALEYLSFTISLFSVRQTFAPHVEPDQALHPLAPYLLARRRGREITGIRRVRYDQHPGHTYRRRLDRNPTPEVRVQDWRGSHSRDFAGAGFRSDGSW